MSEVEIMKKYFILCICVLSAIVICIFPVNKVMADEILYVRNYSENDILDVLTYDDSVEHYLTLMDDENGEICADVTVIIKYEYSDGAWVEVEDIGLEIDCCNGYLVNVGNTYIYSTYGIRYITIKTPDGRTIKYAIKAYADCYGDTSVDCEVVDIY